MAQDGLRYRWEGDRGFLPVGIDIAREWKVENDSRECHIEQCKIRA